MDQARNFLCGAAPLSQETKRYFYSIGILINNCYGLSETTGAMSLLLQNQFELMDFESCGIPLNFNSVKLADSTGEIMIQGRSVFMGYLNQSEETKKSFKSGYFLTGDLGKID